MSSISSQSPVSSPQSPVSIDAGIKGFTFIEVIIASTIFAVISIAVYGVFNSGMNIWRRAENFNLEGRKRILRLEKINKELRCAFVFKKNEVFLNGNKTSLQIPVIIDSEINEVTYRFDPARKALLRSVNRLPEIITAKQENDTLAPRETPYINEVENLAYSYYYFDLQKAEYVWGEDWRQGVLPLAVKINIIFEDEAYNSSIFIPSA
ncbi:MAG: prepilin-type N-terminal cleavage/methylation domain-containing protein [Candidatus Omnitrophota bacterium]